MRRASLQKLQWPIIAILSMTAVILCVIPAPTIAGTGDLTVTYRFDKNPAMQTDQDTITLTIKNDRSQPVKLQQIGVHFDWLQTDTYIFDSSVSDTNVKNLAVGESYVCTISFQVPTLATIGDHGWNIYIKYQEGGMYWSDETFNGATKNDFTVTAYQKADTGDNGVGSGGGTGFILIGGLIVVVIVVIVVLGIIMARRKKPAQVIYQQPPQQAPSFPPAQPYQPPPQQYVPPPSQAPPAPPQQPMVQPNQPMQYQPYPVPQPPGQYPPQQPPQYPPPQP